MDAEYKFDLMLDKLWAQGLIEDTKSKAQKVFYFNMIKKEFKEWLIEKKECSEYNFYDKITEQNYLQFRKWQLAETKAKTKKLEIVIQLFGDNNINTINVIADSDKLKAILSKNNLSSSEAINLIKVNGKKALNPTFYNKCADTIINELKEIEHGESKQETNDRLKRIESMVEKRIHEKSNDEVDDSAKTSIKFDINHWNKETYNLFNYLVLNYKYTPLKTKFINIWFYLQYIEDSRYHFYLKKEDYQAKIKEWFDVEIKKMNKPTSHQKQRVKISHLHTQLKEKLKSIESP
jgi:hypothetical protein